MRPVYYNENNPKAAAWIRELIACGLIARGDVDERSIEDVSPDDLRGYGQHHFFAGLGGWSYSLRLAGWPDDRRIWTASCPCQPYSASGKGLGFADERHLWPALYHLVQVCRPPKILGEQVASKRADPWIDLVHADLEAMGYAFGCVPFPSAGIGAPHIRDRNYWMADADSAGLEGRGLSAERVAERTSRQGCLAFGSADADGGHARAEREQRSGQQRQQSEDGRVVVLADEYGRSRFVHRERPGPVNGFWRAADWLGCTDGKWRPVEPGTFPLADGVPARVGRLCGYGNAINAEAAAEFIRACKEIFAEQLSEEAA